MESIKIHNFGPIKDVDINLSKLMVFIGPQGSGKSAIAKLLTILSDVLWRANVCEKEDPIDEFKDMGIDKYFNSDTYIEYHGREHVNIVYQSGNFDISIDGRSSEETNNYFKILAGLSASKSIGLDHPMTDLQLDKAINENYNYLRANLRFACYIPAERNLAGAVSSSLASLVLSKIPLPNTLMEYMSLFERAKNHFSTYDAPFLGVRYNKNKGADCISVLENNEKYLPLEDCSSGIQSALPMLMVTDYACEDKCFDTYVVEEPEQNLFPYNQREVLNKLISLSLNENCQYMIINTHSPYLLSALNVNMLAAKLSNTGVNDTEVDNIVPAQFRIKSTDVSAFSLGDEPYCKSIMDSKTGLISVNYLDVISDAISSDFNKLYQIYLKSLQK